VLSHKSGAEVDVAEGGGGKVGVETLSVGSIGELVGVTVAVTAIVGWGMDGLHAERNREGMKIARAKNALLWFKFTLLRVKFQRIILLIQQIR
jgi:hypothetical protein